MATEPKTIAKPEAELVPRDEDLVLKSEELRQLDLFGSLKKGISVEKFPGSIVLRRFRKGDVICRQGDRGHSAYYVVLPEDAEALLRGREEGVDHGPERPHADDESEREPRRVATAYVLGGPKPTPRFFPRLFSFRSRDRQPQFIPNDGPTDVDYDTRQAPVCAGDVFGEMSCMTLAPRSATIVVDEDCYVVEFLRNIFDQMQRDAGYRARIDAVYKKRVLSTHLRRLEFFRDLDDEQLSELHSVADLEVVDPGTVICDEGDAAESVYIVRSGVVQVIQGAYVALRAEDISDWPAFCKSLLVEPNAPEDEAASPQHDADGTKRAADGGTADILAAARRAKPSAAQAGQSKQSVADILAAAKAGAKPAKAPAAKPGQSQQSVADILAAAKAGAKPAKAPAAKPGQSKQSVADILAAAKAGAKPAKAPAAKPGQSKQSVADILAAAKAGAKKPDKPTTPSSPNKSSPSGKDAAQNASPGNDVTDTVSTDGPLLCKSAPQATGDPRQAVWAWFTPRLQAAVRSIAAAESAEDSHRELVIAAVNQLVRRRDFLRSADLQPVLEYPEVVETVRAFPQGIKGVKKDWSELEIRVAGTLALRALYPDTLPRRAARQGPPTILAYLTRGDCFGEMAFVLGEPRQATCVAYDHPNDDPARKPGRVELVKIDGDTFRSVISSSRRLKSKIQQLVRRRQSEIAQTEELQPWDARHNVTETEEFRDAGFVQGQSLLLIDLDRCTRCGDCVSACVNTHQDGRSRLFLEGPRFDRFLVPSACRQCLNPACMIGCPVGSIQRGANGQIEIRDWCIGCNLCARQCPYDSIQMHDIGLIPENTPGWLMAPASAVSNDRWRSQPGRPSGWAAGVAPFHWTLDLVERLYACTENTGWRSSTGNLVEPVYFRYDFPLSGSDTNHEHFRLFAVAVGVDLQAWFNGQPLTLQQEAKRQNKVEFEARLPRARLRRGKNYVALQVSPPEQEDGAVYAPDYNQLLLSVRLDPIPEAGSLSMKAADESTQVEMELVTEKAVVCDLCSHLANQQPACVNQCPHDAAIRVNARFEFPVG